jgi:hypothetical protein
MVRLRLATLAVAAGLGLVCGCCSLCQFPLLGRFRAQPVTDSAGAGVMPNGEGPIVEGTMTEGMVPGGPIGPPPYVTPQNTMPPLAPPPRITPQPQAQPAPYTP